jgi:hypothetical protein
LLGGIAVFAIIWKEIGPEERARDARCNTVIARTIALALVLNALTA